jgi:ketosteroid isomerase-like protein
MREKLAAYTAALNRYDLDAVEKMFAEDAVYVSGGVGGEITGRAEIMKAFRAYFRQHTDQFNWDEEVAQLDEYTIQSCWHLKSSTSKRSGIQKMTFDQHGLLLIVEVKDFL